MYWLPYSSHTSHHPSQTPCNPWISYASQKLILDSCNMLKMRYEVFNTFLWHFFPSLKHNFIAYRSSKVSDCIFEIHQLWQLGFSRVHSNCCCSCWFEPEIINIGQSSHNMYTNNLVNFQESTTILNAGAKNVLMLLQNWCSIHARWSKSSLKHSIRFCGIFPSLKQNFIAYRFSRMSYYIFEIHQLW